jgi:hypothetical protein
LIQFIQYYVPNNKWMMPMWSLMSGGSWQEFSSRKKWRKIQLHIEGMRAPIKDIYLPSRKSF